MLSDELAIFMRTFYSFLKSSVDTDGVRESKQVHSLGTMEAKHNSQDCGH